MNATKRSRETTTALSVTLFGAAVTMARQQQYLLAAASIILGIVTYRYGYTIFRGLSRDTAVEIARPLADMLQTAVKKARRQ